MEQELRLREEVAAADNAKTAAEQAYWENALKSPSFSELLKRSMR
jgi:hypothetical protein